MAKTSTIKIHENGYYQTNNNWKVIEKCIEK